MEKAPAMESPWLSSPYHATTTTVHSRRQYLAVSGPPRKLNQPVVIVEAGHGDYSGTWLAVQRLLAPRARVYLYDRAGYGLSDPNDNAPRTAAQIAEELHELLKEAGVGGPYLLVAHSYGGVLSRVFMQRHLDDVCGLVLVDAVQKDTEARNPWPLDHFFAVLGGLQYHSLIGLARDHKLSAGEWKEVVAENLRPVHMATKEREAAEFMGSVDQLRGMRQLELRVLGDRPVAVVEGNSVKDHRAAYEAGVAAGNGSSEDWRVVEEFLGGFEAAEHALQMEQCRLSTNSRVVRAAKSGHNVHLIEPEVIAEVVVEMLDEIGRGSA